MKDFRSLLVVTNVLKDEFKNDNVKEIPLNTVVKLNHYWREQGNNPNDIEKLTAYVRENRDKFLERIQKDNENTHLFI